MTLILHSGDALGLQVATDLQWGYCQHRRSDRIAACTEVRLGERQKVGGRAHLPQNRSQNQAFEGDCLNHLPRRVITGRGASQSLAALCQANGWSRVFVVSDESGRIQGVSFKTVRVGLVDYSHA
jgi:hypothetical protein